MILGSATDTSKHEMSDRGKLMGLNSVLQKEPGIRQLYISHNELCLPFLPSGYYSCLQRNWKQCLCIGGRTNKVYNGRCADGKCNKFCCSVILLLFNEMLMSI